MASEMASSEYAADEMAGSECEHDGDSGTSSSISLISKPGTTKSPVWSYFGFIAGNDGKPKDLQKPCVQEVL